MGWQEGTAERHDTAAPNGASSSTSALGWATVMIEHEAVAAAYTGPGG
jgi:hypothetical protein